MTTLLERIVEAAGAVYGVKPSAIASPYELDRTGRLRRPTKTAKARQVVMYIATTDLGLPTTTVGRLLGGRDHSTVIHGRNKIAKLIEANAIERDLVDVVRRNSGKAR